MGAPNRIKGQETVVGIVLNSKLQKSITAVKDLEVTAKLEKKEEGYLGETTNRYDEIFNGVDGKMVIHIESKTIFDLMQSVIDRAKRRAPGNTINIQTTLNFPNGEKKRVFLQNVFFGNMPLGFGARDQYVPLSLDFSCEDLRLV